MTDQKKTQTEADLSQLSEDDLQNVNGGWITLESAMGEKGSAGGDLKKPAIGEKQAPTLGSKLK